MLSRVHCIMKYKSPKSPAVEIEVNFSLTLLTQAHVNIVHILKNNIKCKIGL